MDFAALRVQLARRWWIVAAAALIALVGALAASASQADEHHRTMHLVLQPDRGVPDKDLPGALDALQSDGPLVQTVIGVLGSEGMLRRVAGEAGLSLDGGYRVESAARPGSSLIDTTLSGPDADTIDQLARRYSQAASDYVSASYSAYELQQLSVDSSGGGGPGTLQVAILALLVGGLLGVGLVAAERLLEPQLRVLEQPRRPVRERVRPEEAAAPSAEPGPPDGAPSPPPRLAPAANGGPVHSEDAEAKIKPDRAAEPPAKPARRKAATESKAATGSRPASRSKATGGSKSAGGTKASGRSKASSPSKPRAKPKRATAAAKGADADRDPANAPEPPSRSEAEQRSLGAVVDDLSSSDGSTPPPKPAAPRAPASPLKPAGRARAAPPRRPARRPSSPKRPSASTEEE